MDNNMTEPNLEENIIFGLLSKATQHDQRLIKAQHIVQELRENAMRQDQLLQKAYEIIHDLRSEQASKAVEQQAIECKAADLVETVAMTFRQVENTKLIITPELPAWAPLAISGDVSEILLKHPVKVKKIGLENAKPQDTLAKLRNTWVGRIYIDHLKHFSAVRSFVFWFWRNGYPIYVNHISTWFTKGKTRKWQSISNLVDFSKKMDVKIQSLTDSVIVKTPRPNLFPIQDHDYLVSPHDQYVFPEIFVAAIKNATVYGGTNLTLVDDEVICHNLYDFERDYTSEELHGRTLIDPKSMRIRWLLHDDTPVNIPLAATFVDACAPNYAHWITEVLPRIVMFCAEQRFKDIPIVVNDGLHKNIMESLFLVAGAEREIITVPIGKALAVDELYVTSVAGYVPFERRATKMDGHSHGMFSPSAFELLFDSLDILFSKDLEQDWPEKIFLRRNSGMRKVTNAGELENLMVSQGYTIIEPEKLSFSQQVQLFRNAKIIVGSSGAALANLVFAPKNTKIVILIGKFPDTSYWYWQNMACASGNIVSYVFGTINNNNTKGIHSDFTIDLDDLMASIEGKK
ncbi:hypothetical protein BH11PSE12_BH11PSE12_23770 [soil metagenome]